jgi:metallo-beta-lactamase class B
VGEAARRGGSAVSAVHFTCPGIFMIRHFLIAIISLAAAAEFGLCAAFAQQAGDNAVIDRHMAAAAHAAKTDLLGPLALCKTATDEPAPAFKDVYEKMSKEPPLEPMQVMDDLYFVGNYWTSSWAVKTSDGFVIIDALDNADEAKQYIEGGFKKLKLDPSDIKYVIVSNSNPDHYGGATYLKNKYQTRIVMSDIEWKVMEDAKFEAPKGHPFSDPPKRDMAVKDGDEIKVGKTVFKLYVIPGRTLGTLATVFDVHDKREAHRAVLWGGTGYDFGPLPDRLELYADTIVKYRDIMKQEKADVLLSNHVSYDAAVAKMAALKERKAKDPNPFVVGEDSIDRFLTVLGECALATKAYVEAGEPGKEAPAKDTPAKDDKDAK